MKHLGDITKINGAEIEPVDVITGGSPCQDLSVAGKRAGLQGERSGLFMEQIRIVKEMRNADKLRNTNAGSTNSRDGGTTDFEKRSAQHGLCGTDKFIRPRYMVWENVPGAFSSNNGEDFRAVLEEIAKIADSTVSIPRPPKRKWTNAGCIMGDGWSVAWRTHDAQFWGVPQRRRRISVVADFGGQSAPEILFKSDSLPGDTQESGAQREEAAGSAGNGFEGAIGVDSYNHTTTGETAVTITASSGASATHSGPMVICLQGNGIDRADTAGCNGKGWTEDVCYTLNTIDRPAVVYDARGNGNGDVCPTMTGDHNGHINDYTAIAVGTFQNTGRGWWNESEVAATVRTPCGGDSVKANLAVTYQKVTGPLMANSHPGSYTGQDAYTDMLVAAVDCRNGTENPNINGTLQAKENGGTRLNLNNIVRNGYIVRRLTPLECSRLQGYPDDWAHIPEIPQTPENITFFCKVWDAWNKAIGQKPKTEKAVIKWMKSPASDSSEYKAYGNSIALPFWFKLLKNISAQYDRPATLGSLFDGIGGFPLCWERINGKCTALWASEIEPFPIAVTFYRFKKGA